LNISRIEAGTIPLEVSTFRLDKLIESLRTLTEEMQRKTGLKVIWDVDPDLPLLKTDAAKLEAILQNLIVNAFKYTPEGEVHIRIKSRSESKSVEFVIEDTGGGISTENLPKIFEGFHQVRSTTSIQGVGLGLTIVKKYLELINGDIQVRSELGKGSTFTVTLPLTEQA
jgi:signal transduction histidine kinase